MSIMCVKYAQSIAYQLYLNEIVKIFKYLEPNNPERRRECRGREERVRRGQEGESKHVFNTMRSF